MKQPSWWVDACLSLLALGAPIDAALLGHHFDLANAGPKPAIPSEPFELPAVVAASSSGVISVSTRDGMLLGDSYVLRIGSAKAPVGESICSSPQKTLIQLDSHEGIELI